MRPIHPRLLALCAAGALTAAPPAAAEAAQPSLAVAPTAIRYSGGTSALTGAAVRCDRGLTARVYVIVSQEPDGAAANWQIVKGAPPAAFPCSGFLQPRGFVVMTDNAGGSALRFGRGQLGARLEVMDASGTVVGTVEKNPISVLLF